jgi:hypothetical protein
MSCARWQELEDERILELRSNRLNGSGTNKIVRSTSATCAASRGETCMFKFAIVAATVLAVFGGGGQPVFAQAAISEPGAYAFYHPDADVLNAGRPIFSDSANASANERDSRIDGHARTPQTLSRHHRRSSAADARLIA